MLTRLLIGGTTLVVGVATYFSYQAMRNATLETLKQNAFLEVTRRAEKIDTWIALRKSETEALASAPMTQTMNWTLIAPYFQAESQRLKTFESYLGVINPQGQFFNILKGETKINLSDRLHFKRGMAGQSTVLDPIISRVSGQPIIVFAAPIWSGSIQDPTRQPVGVVNAPVAIEQVTKEVKALVYGRGSYAFALNSKGEAITHPDSAFMSTLEKPVPSLIQSNDPGLATIAQRMVNRQQGIQLVTIAGIEKYAAFQSLQEAQWSVALVIPRQNIESELRFLDGIAFVVLCLAGTLIGVLAYVQSTEQAQLKKSKLAADAANQAKSEFLTNMSHELRTPLNGILGYAQILSRSKTWGEKERRGVEIINQCGSHLLTLINDILDLAKIEARKLELSPHTTHLPAFLQGVSEICRIRAEQKEVAFDYEPDPNLPTGIIADEKRLRQVLINLLGNAIKFTDKGRVTLHVECLAIAPDQTARLRFEVTDTGVGIAPADISKLFHAFEQVGEQKRKTEGTGIGLAISQQIVQLMGSQIQVESQLGRGSSFSFEVTFPLAPGWAQQQTATVGNIVGYQGAQRQILVIDDHWENRSVLLNLLTPLGFVVTEAEDGQAGLEQMRRSCPDLVITDLVMPVMDGFALLRQMRRDETLRSVKVIVSSASVAQLDQQMSLDAGADTFLTKPVQVSDLFKLLEQLLELTWETEGSATEPVALAQLTALTPPPPVELQTWLALVQEGRLKKLITVAEELGQQDDTYQPFIQQVIQLAKQFQSEKLEQLIQKYLP
jgi:signal transduction histidine kinase/FixJ family two-component response regulator